MRDWDPRYDEILYREHAVSQTHPGMPLRARAAQFAAFQALTGFEEEIEEEGRWTEQAAELDEERKERLNDRLRRLAESGEEAVFVWFRPDGKKAGGSYCRSRSAVRKLDALESAVRLKNGERIPLLQLYDIETDSLEEL